MYDIVLFKPKIKMNNNPNILIMNFKQTNRQLKTILLAMATLIYLEIFLKNNQAYSFFLFCLPLFQRPDIHIAKDLISLFDEDNERVEPQE